MTSDPNQRISTDVDVATELDASRSCEVSASATILG